MSTLENDKIFHVNEKVQVSRAQLYEIYRDETRKLRSIKILTRLKNQFKFLVINQSLI